MFGCCVFFFYTVMILICFFFFFSSRRRHTRSKRDWSSDVCSSDLPGGSGDPLRLAARERHRLLAHHVIALLEPPQRELQVGGGRRADVDEIERGKVAELEASAEQRDRVYGRVIGGAVY